MKLRPLPEGVKREAVDRGHGKESHKSVRYIFEHSKFPAHAKAKAGSRFVMACGELPKKLEQWRHQGTFRWASVLIPHNPCKWSA